MDEGIAGTVADWDQRPVSGGYRGLQELVDREFSGAVEAAGCWALFINGRVVGLYEEREGTDGPEQEPVEIERFEGASGTAHEAPHPAVPLLLAMQARGGEVVARDSTKDRPLEEIHRELEAEGFTGYLVLSEHVLSGEYYVVYQGGRSMSVAFIGGARRLKTDEEAFERATKEVGIYEARAVRIEVFDVPDAGPGAAVADDPGQDQAGEEDRRASSTPGEPDAPETDAPDPGTASEGRDDAPVEEVEPVVARDADVDASGESDAEAPSGVATSDGPDPTPAVAELDRERPPGESTDEGGTAAPATESEEAGTPDPQVEGTPAPGDGAPAEPEADEPAASAAPSGDRVARLETRLDELAADQADLAATVERLSARLDEVVGSGESAFEPAERRSPDEALAETTLLVRYRSESEPTLETVREGGGDREALAANLVLEPRTPFDAGETAVDGRRYEEFLRDTVEYRFVAWLVSVLPVEVRATGATESLSALYDALPAVDRAEFRQSATETGGQFDIVLRDREGEPLVVVEVAEGAEPPSRATAEGLIQRARDARAEAPALAAAFLVTTSFVDGDALEPVRDATRSGVLSRDRRKSYVSLSSGGFHLCLVEAGSESFHLAVPQL